jgi:hypothetical protein
MLRPVVNVRFGKAAPQRRDPLSMSAMGRSFQANRGMAGRCCGASDGRNEPEGEVPNLCCVRSQKNYYRDSMNFQAAMQQEERPFMRAAQRFRSAIAGLQDETSKSSSSYKPQRNRQLK